MSLGEYRLPEPITGTWTLPGFPPRVVAVGRFSERAQWKQAYPGVVEQYREARPQNAAHLKVYADRTWSIDHLDDDNPDQGRVIEHGLNDTGPGKAIKVVAVGAAAASAGYLLGPGFAALVEALNEPPRSRRR